MEERDLMCLHVHTQPMRTQKEGIIKNPFHLTTLPMILGCSRKAPCRKHKKMIWKMIGK